MKFMEKNVFAISLLVTAGTVHAQSSVTLFGVIDTGITYFSNQGGHTKVMEDGYVNAPSMFGFAGKEDLGDGNRAIFRLSQSFYSTSGKVMASGSAFGQESFVGLENDRYGKLTLGRQNDFSVDMLKYTGISGPIYGYHPGNYDRITGQQLNNSIKYDSQIFGGLRGGVIYSFGSTSGNPTNTGRAFGLKLTYQNGPFSLGASMTDLNGTTINPAKIGLAYAFGRSTTSSANSGIELHNLTTSTIGAAYQMSSVRFVASYVSA